MPSATISGSFRGPPRTGRAGAAGRLSFPARARNVLENAARGPLRRAPPTLEGGGDAARAARPPVAAAAGPAGFRAAGELTAVTGAMEGAAAEPDARQPG